MVKKRVDQEPCQKHNEQHESRNWMGAVPYLLRGMRSRGLRWALFAVFSLFVVAVILEDQGVSWALYLSAASLSGMASIIGLTLLRGMQEKGGPLLFRILGLWMFAGGIIFILIVTILFIVSRLEDVTFTHWTLLYLGKLGAGDLSQWVIPDISGT